MKIAFVCTEKLPVPPVAGGAVQLYIEGILPYLSKYHEITVYGISHPSLPSKELKDNVMYIRLDAESQEHYVNNLKAAITSDFDLIHVFNRPRWVLALSENLPDTRFSLSLHNEMFEPEKISADLAERCIGRVELINTVSRFIADGVQKLYPVAGPKLRVVYSGADTAKYVPVWSPEGLINQNFLKKKYGLEDYRVILFVGRLGPKKGAHILLKAVREVMNTYKDTALVVIGSKWYGENQSSNYTRLLEVVSRSLKGPIVFTGFIPPSEISLIYNIGDIFVCPSQWSEPLARVHYEAMAAGLPIITTNRGGNAEVIEGLGNGFAIDDYSNPSAFAHLIGHLLDNPWEANEMGIKGRKLAEEKYNWQRVAQDVLDGFATIIC